jgi:hypothetical protein
MNMDVRMSRMDREVRLVSDPREAMDKVRLARSRGWPGPWPERRLYRDGRKLLLHFPRFPRPPAVAREQRLFKPHDRNVINPGALKV